MVQLKYCCDRHDYFKYDLITHVLRDLKFDNYVFIPMLTHRRDNKEGNTDPNKLEGKDKGLLQFMNNCRIGNNQHDLNHWKTWLSRFVKKYKTIEPVNSMFFENHTRDIYWDNISPLMKEGNSLIFVDPDTGLQTGKESYRKRVGPEKYILENEIRDLFQNLSPTSILMIYQHMQRNRNKHFQNQRTKYDQLKAFTGSDLTVTYREDHLAFLFVGKNKPLFNALKKSLRNYYASNESDHHSIFPKE